MSLQIKSLHPSFMGEVSNISLKDTHDETVLAELRAAMDEHGVLVFRGQKFDDEQHLAFAQRMGGELHAKTGSRTIAKNRFGNEALTDISNVDPTGDKDVLETSDRRRLYSLANRLWHTDASFEYPAGRYSMLYAYVIPEVSADTQFADMRTAYDNLDSQMKTRIDDLMVHHSIAYSRQTLGFEFSPEEAAKIQGAVHPMVRDFPNVDRKGLYLASHASSIEGVPLPEARLLIKQLMEHATQAQFVYNHSWKAQDLVIWDNRATMHRATPFDDQNHVRELRRVTTLEIPPPEQSRAFASQ